MRCGDKGNLTAAGTPCQQPINAKAGGCLHHNPETTPAQKQLEYLKGAAASRLQRYLPASTPPPEFTSTASIQRWAEQTARKVLTGDLDPRAASEARQLAALCVSARQADAQQALVEALLKLEGGGAAFVMLQKLTSGLADGPRKPLPGRLTVVPPRPEPTA